MMPDDELATSSSCGSGHIGMLLGAKLSALDVSMSSLAQQITNQTAMGIQGLPQPRLIPSAQRPSMGCAHDMFTELGNRIEQLESMLQQHANVWNIRFQRFEVELVRLELTKASRYPSCCDKLTESPNGFCEKLTASSNGGMNETPKGSPDLAYVGAAAVFSDVSQIAAQMQIPQSSRRSTSSEVDTDVSRRPRVRSVSFKPDLVEELRF
mmetsp:Transcript_2591/g.3887  ORF Transcript_2591/g.3887 Transcript_2591/m.3887 type:complete len:210 (-) Transcript_2591:7-636(-)